ncbi:two-component sensor histidine kinase [Paucibacter oligotrophus]|uniref:Two-component sensor histidine kinase n=1 Tax=Roseateles oligotrophus TaxID=1769250 RepID=A0A840L4V7_9BURK|nr:histidine kinase [Roseateles oligotrophus]MBB4841565.1 two-component sensor histidine kinase [Roseateles oligotrophus]
MSFRTTMSHALKHFFVLRKHRPEPAWARLLIDFAIALGFALVFTVIPALLQQRLGDWHWLNRTFAGSLIVAGCISLTFHALFRSFELLAPERILQALALRRRGGWAWVFFPLFSLFGSALGMSVALLVLGWITASNALWEFVSNAEHLRNFLLISLVITALNWVFWKFRIHHQTLQLQASDAQLRLLQAQIEPHFLFNTLANVQSLIDLDTAKAKQMLEAFTDYLRASMSQMRLADTSLGAELDMAQSYLTLLQIRMAERLRFRLALAPELRGALLPPLLLQPLIENAIHHGLEPKIEGGEIVLRVSALRDAQGEFLEICVDDDGLGLESGKAGARRKGRAGNGIALANIRSRLQTRYGEQASLSLQALPMGTRAVLRLPLLLPSPLTSNPAKP